MIYDFHTHTFLSDGGSSPIGLIRFAVAAGYRCIAITDHASYSNLDYLIEGIKKDCHLAEKYWDIVAIPGVIVVVHGESIVEKVEAGTNLEAVSSKYVDLLAHPGIFTPDEANTAVKNDVYIEITSRKGHGLTNGIVAKVGREAGVRFLINSDAHNHSDLFQSDFQSKVGIGSGLGSNEVKNILTKNSKDFLSKIRY